ncbi:MAG: hypothetical protein JWN17_1216, partial [Frankiales bacterium]|nr:hypothetical protein [Frankiales bacterium]
MHDFFVSYAHEERPRAQEVVRRLRELGQTVWLDEATDADGDRLAGIPAGQRHRDVIEAGIDQAATFLVLDSPAWWRSTYCGQELDHAHAVGKRVAVLGHAGDERLGAVHVAAPADDPALVVRELAPGDEAARAHARLHADMDGGGRRRSWWTTLLQPTDQTRDAELVTSQDPASTGLSVGPALAEFCGHLLDAARRRRRTIRSVLATGVTVLLVLAFLAVVGRQTTVDSRNHAAAAAARAVSLQLAQKALSASSTASGLELADQAVRSESTSAARSVQAQLRSRAQYLRYAGIRPGAYLSAAVSEDGDTAVLATVDSFVVADLTTGTSRVLPAPSTNRLPVARLAVAPDGARAYAVTQSGNLLCVDVPQRNIRMGAATEVADLSVAADGSLWWATSNGDVAHSAGCPGDASAERFRVPSTVTAFGVLPQGLAVLSADYVLSTYSLPPGPPDLTQQLDPRSAVPLESLPTESSRAWSVDPDEHGPDQVVVCGSTVHVAAQTNGTALFANWYAGFDDTGRPLGTRDAIGATQGLACSSGGAAWAVPQLSTRPRALPDGAPYPVGVVDDQDAGSIVAVADSADHARTVVVHSSGRLDVLDPSAAPWGRTAGEATVAAPLSDGTVTVDDDGTVRMLTADSDSVLGRLDSPPPVNAVVALPDRVLV